MKNRQTKDSTVMVFGVFDIIHSGHLFFLHHAKKYGSKLIAVVTRDARVKAQKGRIPIMKEKDRLALVGSLKMVDKALLGDANARSPSIIRTIQPDIIAVGYDQNIHHPMLLAQLSTVKKKPKIMRIKAYLPHIYSSTRYRKK
jgi:FAD synthetase